MIEIKNLDEIEKKLKELRKILSPAQIRAIQNRIVKRAVSAGNTTAKKKIRELYNISAYKHDNEVKDPFKKYMTIYAKDGVGKIIVDDAKAPKGKRRIPLIYFASPSVQKVNPKVKAKTKKKTGGYIRPYVKVKVKKAGGLKVLKHAFVAEVKAGKSGRTHKGIFIRESKKRLPIKELKGPTFTQIFKNKQVLDEVEKAMEESAIKTFNHEVKWRLSKLNE